MAIRQTQDVKNLDKQIEEKWRNATILRLKYVGEQCIRNARLNGTYTDRTGNLRSSIGYVIVDRGQVVYESSFQTIKNGEEGTKEGKAWAHEIASQFSSGITLIVVAGMSYATYVQRRGYNVTASAELIAEQLISQLKLKAKVEHPL